MRARSPPRCPTRSGSNASTASKSSAAPSATSPACTTTNGCSNATAASPRSRRASGCWPPRTANRSPPARRRSVRERLPRARLRLDRVRTARNRPNRPETVARPKAPAIPTRPQTTTQPLNQHARERRNCQNHLSTHVSGEPGAAQKGRPHGPHLGPHLRGDPGAPGDLARVGAPTLRPPKFRPPISPAEIR